MKDCVKEVAITRKPCCNKDCRLHLDFEKDLNCTDIAVRKYGPMTLEEIGKRHKISTVRAKQLVDSALVKLKKTFSRINTI